MTALAAVLLFAAAPAFADQQHHQQPTTDAAGQEQPGAVVAQQPDAGMPNAVGQSGAGTVMMGTPCGTMPMMGMMGGGAMPRQPGTMSAGGAGAAMMPGAMTDHLEGRIAFVAAELKITEAQQKAWNDFADALRANAKRLSDARGAMMQSQAVPGLVERLDQKERSLSVLLDGARAIKSTFGNLYGELDDEQKKTAEELTPTYLGHTL
jgi:hypothetical protein